MSDTNDQLILISGISTTGKSAALRNIRDQEKWLYLNTEAGKRLPFRNKFINERISDPYQVPDYLAQAAENRDQLEGIVLDSLTFMMDMFETQIVNTATNTMQAWGQYAQFLKDILQRQIVEFSKPVIVIAHVREDLDEKAMEMRTAVPIKGSLKNNGIEAYFSTVVSTKRMSLKDLEPYMKDNKLLTVNEEEEALGFKYVFQTRLTKQTTGERIRSPMGMFTPAETFMDNDAQLLLDHLNSYYGS